jgi:hypothetical protein
MRIPALLLAFLAAVATARATTFVPAGETMPIDPGFVDNGPLTISVAGVLLLTAPGTYTASNWTVSGELRLGAPGNYTVIASTGAIIFNRTAGAIKRSSTTSSAPIGLTFRHAGDFSLDITDFDPSISVTQGSPPVFEAPPLVNLSTRIRLAAGQTHISGFVVGGRLQRRVLVRAIGPTLSTFGVANPLATPVVTVFSNQQVMRTNSGWSDLEDIFALVGAFPLPFASRDAALLASLNPGAYTVQVGGGTGEVLLEIYYLD